MDSRRVSICAGVIPGHFAISNAAAAAANGVAIDVPDLSPYPPVFSVDRIALPGAATSTLKPRWEYDARLVPGWTVAATERTPVSAAG